MKIKKKNLKMLIERFLRESNRKAGYGGYEYEKRGSDIYIVKYQGQEKNSKVKKGSAAYIAIAKEVYPELIIRDEIEDLNIDNTEDLSQPDIVSVIDNQNFSHGEDNVDFGKKFSNQDLINGLHALNDFSQNIVPKKPYKYGKHIAAIQVSVGMRGSEVDGVYGPGTAKIVAAYQRENNLNFNNYNDSGDTPGVVGKTTIDHILKNSIITTVRPEEKENKKASTGIEYFEGYDSELIQKPSKPSSSRNMLVGKCQQDQCAQFLSDTFKNIFGEAWIGNAWHAHRRLSNKYSAFVNYNIEQLDSVTKIFSKINKDPNSDHNSIVKDFILSVTPDQQKFKSLELGDVVGLYNPKSSKFTKAFFEGATNRYNMGTGEPLAKSGYFIKEDGSAWNESDIGKDITFRPGETLSNGGGFGMNTHIGFVGAKYNGIPIIYHNIQGRVYATGLNAMSPGRMMIVWAGSYPG